MPIDSSQLKAVIFDYGNTLIQFDHTHALQCDEAMIELLQRRCGPVDREKFLAMRNADRMAPYRDGYKESKLSDLFTNHIRQLYGIEPTAELLAEMAEVRFESFVEVIEAPNGLQDVLSQLAGRYPLAVLSNYPDGEAIRASSRNIGIESFFEVIVVSGDVGRVKPHPLSYETVLTQLGVQAGEALHVGDNWLADVQGAKRAGLLACHFNRWETPERFEPAEGDLPPDLVTDDLSDLVRTLLTGKPAQADSPSPVPAKPQ